MALIKIVQIDEVLPYLFELFYEHRNEVTTNKELMQLKPDIKRYYDLENKGNLIVLAAYINDKVVGYSVNFIQNHIHYSDLTYSINDLLFVTKSERNSRLGLQLIRKTEEECKLKGSKFHLWHAKTDTNLSNLLQRLKYKTQDIIYSKEL